MSPIACFLLPIDSVLRTARAGLRLSTCPVIRAGRTALACAGIAILLSLSIAPVEAACPSYVKKTTTEGTLDRLPKGFFCYGARTSRGIYKSPLNEFKPLLLAGARDDVARTIAISDDGTWLVYASVSAKKIFVMKTDGSGRIAMPTTGDIVGTREMACGIFRRGPMGQEIIYKCDDRKIRAIGIDWSGAAPKFGTNRTIGSFSENVRTTVSASGNKIFTEISGVRFATIPDEGKGTAGDADLWKYSGTNEGGCFTAMSHDGAHCVFNPGFYGDVNCIPQEKGGMWHKGFVVAPFQSKTAPATTMSDLVMTKANSVNWCPSQYRFGAVWEVDFSQWYFGNKPEYVIGTQGGEKTPVHGVWLVNWQSNTWTLLTSTSTRASFPAVHFEESTASLSDNRYKPSRAAATRRTVTSYYNLCGRRTVGMGMRTGACAGVPALKLRKTN